MKTKFEGQVDSPKTTNLHYDDIEPHYNVNVNITGAMAKRFMCKACNKSCAYEATNRCNQKCSPPSKSPAPNVIDILGAKRV